MEKKELLLERLKEYGKAGWYPFHMPGHKRQAADTVLGEMGNPFSIDITEIAEFDNLHHPEGILKKSMEWAASVYGADRTWYLVNGSSGGILSALSAVARPGETVLVARNCHKAVYHGVILNRLNIHYLYPQIIPEMGIQGSISPDAVEKSLTEHPEIRAVVIVSPTYDGVVSDVGEIARVTHEHGIPLVVDEAHGAHFSFGKMADGRSLFPESAVTCGADIVIQSLHKTLPSMTQTAVLHMQGNLVDEGRLERYLQMYQSSSPSYVFMAGIEACIFEMEQKGKERIQAFAGRLARLRERLLEMRHLVILDERTVKREGTWEIRDPGKVNGFLAKPLWYALDCSRIVISCRNCVLPGKNKACNERKALSGAMLMERLREEYQLEMEMCGADYVVAITTVMDTEEGLNRLADGLLAIDGMLERDQLPLRNGWTAGEPVMNIADALDAPACKRQIAETAGHISAEFVYLYPPGIPILVPGEQIREDVLNTILEYKEQGLPVQGMEDRDCKLLDTVQIGLCTRCADCTKM